MELSPLEWVWATAVFAIWISVAVAHVASLRWGAILGITSGRHAILRKDRPAKFWVTWLVLALPFIVLQTLLILGLISGGPAK